MFSRPVALNPGCPVAFAFSEELLDDDVLGPDRTAECGSSISPEIEQAIRVILHDWGILHKKNCSHCRGYTKGV